jgi:hypothetical protein
MNPLHALTLPTPSQSCNVTVINHGPSRAVPGLYVHEFRLRADTASTCTPEFHATSFSDNFFTLAAHEEQEVTFHRMFTSPG